MGEETYRGAAMINVKLAYNLLAEEFSILKYHGEAVSRVDSLEDAVDVLARVIVMGTKKQIALGLDKQYIAVEDKGTTLRGRLDLNTMIKESLIVKKQVAFIHDEFSQDTPMNRMLKCTLVRLLDCPQVSKATKGDISTLLPAMLEVSEIMPTINFNNAVYSRHTKNYQLIIELCKIVLSCVNNETDKQQLKDLLADEYFMVLFQKLVYKRMYTKSEDQCIIRALISKDRDLSKTFIEISKPNESRSEIVCFDFMRLADNIQRDATAIEAVQRTTVAYMVDNIVPTGFSGSVRVVSLVDTKDLSNAIKPGLDGLPQLKSKISYEGVAVSTNYISLCSSWATFDTATNKLVNRLAQSNASRDMASVYFL